MKMKMIFGSTMTSRMSHPRRKLPSSRTSSNKSNLSSRSSRKYHRINTSHKILFILATKIGNKDS